jgi:hypothetical protein
MLSLFKIIFMSVKGFIANVFDLFKQWFSVAEKFIQDHIHVAVVVTENVKKFIDNPVGDLLLTVIDEKVPGDLADKVRDVLPKVLLGLHIIDDCKDLDQEETLKCIAEKIQASSDDFKDVFFHSLAVQLAEKMSDGKITFSDAIALVEWYYRYKVKQ